MTQPDSKDHSENHERLEHINGAPDRASDTLAWKLAWRRELWRKWLGLADSPSPEDEVSVDQPIVASTAAKMAIEH